MSFISQSRSVTPTAIAGVAFDLPATLAPRAARALWCSMIYRAKLRVKAPGDQVATEKRRSTVLKLVEKHGGKNGTPNPCQHVVGIFTGKTAMKAFRTEARAALST